MTLWPTATVVGQLAANAPPRIRVESIKPKIGFSGDCDLRADGFSCLVPAAQLDLRLVADGYASEYLWSVKAPAGGQLRLPQPLQFARGPSLSGWVTAESRRSLSGVTVELTPVTSVSDAPQTQRRIEKTNARGFFQLRGVAAGKYTAVAKTEGFASRPAEVSVEEGKEIRAPALVLRPLSTLDVLLTPPVAPDGTPWVISLHRALPMTTAGVFIDKSPATASGSWRRNGLAAGQYWLSVEDGRGSRFDGRSVEVGSASPLITIRSRSFHCCRSRAVTLKPSPSALSEARCTSEYRAGHRTRRCPTSYTVARGCVSTRSFFRSPAVRRRNSSTEFSLRSSPAFTPFVRESM